MKLRARPYKGKWCSRSEANKMNDFLATLPKPDRTELQREASEHFEYLKQRYAQEYGNAKSSGCE